MKLNKEDLGPIGVVVADWDITKSFKPRTITTDYNTGTTYISRKYVPANTPINNINYWKPIIINDKSELDLPDSIYNTKVVKPNLIDGKNILTQKMLSTPNTKYVIKYKFYIQEDITMPEDCVLYIDGGYITADIVEGADPFKLEGVMNSYDDHYTLLDMVLPFEACFDEDKITVTHFDETSASGGTGRLAPGAVKAGTISENALNTEDVDLTEDGKLQLADREYNSINPDGMGYKILRQADDKGNPLTFAEQVTEENTIYEIRYDFDLDGARFVIPARCVLSFNGGSIVGGTLVGSDTIIEGEFSANCTTEGTFIKNDEFVKSAYNTKQHQDVTVYNVTKQEDFDEALARCAAGINVKVILDGKTYRVSRLNNQLNGDFTIIGNNHSTIDLAHIEYQLGKAVDIDFSSGYWKAPLNNSSPLFGAFIDGVTDEPIDVQQSKVFEISVAPIRIDDDSFKIDISSLNDELKNKTFHAAYGWLDSLWDSVSFTATHSDSTYLYCSVSPRNFYKDTITSELDRNFSHNRGTAYKDARLHFKLFNYKKESGIYYDNQYIYIPIGYSDVKFINKYAVNFDVRKNCIAKNVFFENGSIIFRSDSPNATSGNSISLSSCRIKNTAAGVVFYTPSVDVQGNISLIDCEIDNYGLFTGSVVRYSQIKSGDGFLGVGLTGNTSIINCKFKQRDHLYFKGNYNVIDAYSPLTIKDNIFENFGKNCIAPGYGKSYILGNKIYCTEEFAQDIYNNLLTDRGAIYLSNVQPTEETALANTDTTEIAGNLIYNIGTAPNREDLVRGIYIDEGRIRVNVHHNVVLHDTGFSIDSRIVNPHLGNVYTISSAYNKIQYNIVTSSFKCQYEDTLTGDEVPQFDNNILLCGSKTPMSILNNNIADPSIRVDVWKQTDNGFVYIDGGSDVVSIINGNHYLRSYVKLFNHEVVDSFAYNSKYTKLPYATRGTTHHFTISCNNVSGFFRIRFIESENYQVGYDLVINKVSSTFTISSLKANVGIVGANISNETKNGCVIDVCKYDAALSPLEWANGILYIETSTNIAVNAVLSILGSEISGYNTSPIKKAFDMDLRGTGLGSVNISATIAKCAAKNILLPSIRANINNDTTPAFVMDRDVIYHSPIKTTTPPDFTGSRAYGAQITVAFDTTPMTLYWNGDSWVFSNGFTFAKIIGYSTDRPKGVGASGGVLTSTRDIGFQFFDKTLNKPIFASAIANNGTVTWVDATGAIV